MYSISSKGRVRRFGTVRMRSSSNTSWHSSGGWEVNLCELGEEGKKSNICESSERRSDESTVHTDMVIGKKEVRRGSYSRLLHLITYRSRVSEIPPHVTCMY